MYQTRSAWLPPPDPSGPVSCASCGCRLVEVERRDGPAWRHFPSLHPGADARGDRPGCVDALHGRDGWPLGREPLDGSLDESFLPDPQSATAYGAAR